MKNKFLFQNIRIENTNLCGYKCIMCPRERLTRKKGIMSLEDFKFLIDHFKLFQGQLDLHGYGEPLLDPNLIKKVEYARYMCVNSTIIFFTTLGVPIKPLTFYKLAKAGINQIYISCYGFNREEYKTIHGVDNFDLVCQNLKLLSEEKKLANNSFEIILITHNRATTKSLTKKTYDKKDFFKWVESLDIDTQAELNLHNYGNGRDYNKAEKTKTCSIAWGYRQSVLQITWDLKIIPCCFDFNSSIILGDLKKQSFQEIFFSTTYKNFINAHLTNKLEKYPVCNNCERDLR